MIGSQDPLREHPNSRDDIFKIYQSELEKLGHNYYISMGNKKKREIDIKNIISNILELIKVFNFVESYNGVPEWLRLYPLNLDLVIQNREVSQ